MSNFDKLQAALEAQMEPPIYMSTKGEIVDYYKSEYGSKWRGHIQKALAELTGKKEKNIARRFDPSRLQNPEKRNKAQYEKLGQQLPPKQPKRPPKKFKVIGKGWLDPSPKRKGKGEQPRYRDFEVDFSGIEAFDFATNPSIEAFFDAYGVDGGQVAPLFEADSFDVIPG